MMDLKLNILLIVVIALFLTVVAFVVIPHFHASRSSKERLTRKVKDFLSADVSDNGGCTYVELINEGFQLSLVIGNDSRGFSYQRQLDDFRRMNTSKAASVINELGGTHEQYYI